MSKKVFDQIAEGLQEALAVAHSEAEPRGRKTAPAPSPDLIEELLAAKANGDPEKYLAGISVAKAHHIAAELSRLRAALDEAREAALFDKACLKGAFKARQAAEADNKVLRAELDTRIAELEKQMENGQGEHGQPGYVREIIWNGWCGEVSALRRLRGLMKTLDERAALGDQHGQ